MSFIIIIRLYYCRCIVSFVTDAETSVVIDVTEDVTSVTVVTYVAYVLCDVMTSSCMSTLGYVLLLELRLGYIL